jgi:hypothetical protein
MCVGKFPDRGNVGRVCAELVCELFAAQMVADALSSSELFDTLCERCGIAAAQQDADLKPFGWIGLAYGLRPRHWLALAAFEWMRGESMSSHAGYSR